MTPYVFRALPKALISDRRGVASLYFTIAIGSMVVLTMAGLDLMRVHLVRSRMWAAADSAILAAGNALGTDRWRDVGVAYFNANMGGSYMNSTATITTSSFVEGVNGVGAQTVSLTVNGNVPLISVGLLDIGSMNISATSRAVRQSRQAEVTMVLDNTGSMAGTKLTSMKQAANTLVDALIGNNAGGNSVMGLVPFNETVRIGKSAWLQNGSFSPLTAASWNGCMFERQNPSRQNAYTLDATTPANQSFTPYTRKRCRTVANNRQCEQIVEQTQAGCVTAPVQFLNTSSANLKNAVAAMRADGSTMVAGGLIWGWRMLDPAWRGTQATAWGDATLPKDVDPAIQKIIILLTDGDNEVSESTSGGYSTYRSPFGDAGQVTYINPETNTKVGPVGFSGKNDADANAQLAALCNAVKNSGLGIDLYTITFGNGISAATRTLMSNCATSASYYFNAPSDAELQRAFINIGDRLSELRLTE